jgi:hypothetical protein
VSKCGSLTIFVCVFLLVFAWLAATHVLQGNAVDRVSPCVQQGLTLQDCLTGVGGL